MSTIDRQRIAAVATWKPLATSGVATTDQLKAAGTENGARGGVACGVESR